MHKILIQTSELIYDFLIQFYPKRYRDEFGEEMKFVFSESLEDAYEEKKEQGIITVWTRTLFDAGKSMLDQHLDNMKGGDFMKKSDPIMDNKMFLWVAVGTVLLLLIPVFLMFFQIKFLDPGSGYEVLNWNLFDFVVMGVLLFGMGSIFVLAARKFNKNKLIVGILVAFVFLWLWAELAVGVFTNWRS